MGEEGESVRYHCLVGHEIPASRLEQETAMTTLDRGAEVRLCREHGTAIAITRLPAGSQAEEQ